MKVSVDVKYISNSNPFNYVNIFSDDSFVVVGDLNVSDDELLDMIGWNDVKGFTQDFDI